MVFKSESSIQESYLHTIQKVNLTPHGFKILHKIPHTDKAKNLNIYIFNKFAGMSRQPFSPYHYGVVG